MLALFIASIPCMGRLLVLHNHPPYCDKCACVDTETEDKTDYLWRLMTNQSFIMLRGESECT